jgi:hypothetical protein
VTSDRDHKEISPITMARNIKNFSSANPIYSLLYSQCPVLCGNCQEFLHIPVTGGSQLWHSSCTDNTHSRCQDIAHSTPHAIKPLYTQTVLCIGSLACALPSDAMGDIMQLQSWHPLLLLVSSHCTSHNVHSKKTERGRCVTSLDRYIHEDPIQLP